MEHRKGALEDMVAKKDLVSKDFWAEKRVFLTGHTGFKGSWLSLWLSSMGAKVTGFSLAPNTHPNLYEILNLDGLIERSYIKDIRDIDALRSAIVVSEPEIIFHLAAQPLVRQSYIDPAETYSTNIMGTVNLLEAMRGCKSVKAAVVVTTDKCYENKEWAWGYRENEPMGGYDPYSSSKGCVELIVSAYRNSFFSDRSSSVYKNAIGSARAGNVIGGGDWSEDRLIPDAIRAFERQKVLKVRNPLATRPWQHVLEPLSGYLTLARCLYEGGDQFSGGWNFGPNDKDARTVEEVINLLIDGWKGAQWELDSTHQPHEAHSLKLDCSKARNYLGWIPRWSLEDAMIKINEWNQAFSNKRDMREVSLSQIAAYLKI